MADDAEHWHPIMGQAQWLPGEELPTHNEYCFVCGSQAEERALSGPFTVVDERTVQAPVQFGRAFQGAPLFAHGGAVAAVLDDACGYVCYLVSKVYVTARLEIDYRKPVLLDAPLIARARYAGTERRKVFVTAELVEAGGDEEIVLARASGLFVTVDLAHFRP